MGCDLKVTSAKVVAGIKAEMSVLDRGKQEVSMRLQETSLGMRKGEHTVGKVVTDVLG